MKRYLLIILLSCTLLPSCNGDDRSGDQGTDASDQIPVYLPVIIQSYSHDADAWTQGLFYENVFVYDRDTFQQLDEFSYTTEGWGITCDGQYLIMSDGTDVLHYLDPDDYGVVEQVNVTADGNVVTCLNELEYINGNIYANIWQADRIAIIQPDGEVIGWIDLEGILSSADCSSEIDVLNGIAYNPYSNSIYVTVKYWRRLFELEFVP